MEAWLVDQQQIQQQQQQQQKKELPQPEEMPPAIKKDLELLNFLSSEEQGRGCRSLYEKSCAIASGDDGVNEVIAVDSSESSDESTELCDVSRKNILSSVWEPQSRDGGRYSGRLRTRAPTSKRSNLDFATYAELGFSTDESENYVNCLIEQQLRNVEVLPTWGSKKHRTDQSSYRLRQVSGSPRSNQATQRRNLRRRTKSSQDGLTSWSRCLPKNNSVPFASNHISTARASPRLKHEICCGDSHLGRSLHEGNAVAVCRNVSSGYPPSSLGKNGFSSKRNKPVRRGNMVTHVESFPRELRGHHEGPVTSMKPAMRKRKAETGADDLPDYHVVNALSSGRAWSGGTERDVQQQFYELTSDAEVEIGNSGFGVTNLFQHSSPLSANLPFSTFHEANIEEFLHGETGRGDPRLDTLDAIVNGDWPPSFVNGCQNYPCEEPLSNPDVDIGTHLYSYSQGGADIFSVQDTDDISIASEPSTNDSLGAAQSDEDYHPPGKADDVGTPIPTGYPSKSRRSLSFRHISVARRVGPISTLQSDEDPVLSTHCKAARPMSDTPDAVNRNPIPDNPNGPASTAIDSATNDVRSAILEAPEDLEPDNSEDLELDEEDEDGEEGLFNLNEPPSQQPQKNSKVRKKHRPKVFREGRPYRRRKPKEGTSKTTPSEGKTEVGKPKARKKRATSVLKSTQGDLRKKEGTRAKPVAATCGPAASGCSQCQEKQQRCMHSQERRTEATEESPQTPAPVLRRGPKNSLILGEAFDSLHAQDCSPFSYRPSGSRCRSRKRDGEESDRLNGAVNPASRLGLRRELFKRARAMPRKRNPIMSGIRRAVFTSSSESSLTSCNEGNLEEGEEGISGHRYNLHTDVGLKYSSKIAGKEIVLSRINGRLRAAARAKAGHSNLSKRGKRTPSRRSPSIATSIKQLVKKMSNLELDENHLQLVPHVKQQTALVKYDGQFNPLRKKKFRVRVMLEEEDKRVWRLLMAQGTSFEDRNSEKDAPRDWEEERATMKARAEKFINRMHLVQGDRRFSIWKGSVVDSVVGAFLTQNVSDHLSSSAFMCIAARFPVPRKKNVAADISQETTVTEVRVEEASEISQKSSGLPVSSDDAEAVQESRKTDYHVEEEFDNNEKSSVTGEGLSMCGNQQAYDFSSAKMPDGIQGRGSATENLEGRTSQDNAGTEAHAERSLTEVRGPNSSCSSNPSQGQCCSPARSLTSQAEESLEIRGSEQQKIFGLPKDLISLHSGPRNVFCVSSSHNDMNSVSPTALVTLGDREGTQMARPAADSWIQTDSQLLEGSLIVDLSPRLIDIVKHPDAFEKSLHRFKRTDVLRTLELVRNSASEEKIRFSDPPRLEMARVAAEEVAISSGSVVSSSGTFFGQKLSHLSVILASEVNCVVGEEHRSNAGGIIFPSHTFDTIESSDQQLVPSEDTNNQLQGGLSLRTGLSVRTELSNLRTYKVLMRQKIHVLRKTRTKRGPNSRAANGKNNSEIISSTSVDMGPNSRAVNGKNISEITSSTSVNQANESGEKKRRPVVGLTGIARAKLEESNITSKVAFDWEAVRLKYTGPTMSANQEGSAHFGSKSFGSSHVENGVDWDAVRSAKLEDIAEVIKERGMNNVLAGRIKAFLERVQKEHGSVDLEWLRTVSVEEAKSFLLSVRGLGLKSVECIRLLTLHHLAFPVDTNVGRICVRLGWVPLEPLPEELQLHLLELYPVQETIQKYLWPRLCSLDQRTLYELHYQMITFGKVFCTKSRPNCNACPMRDDCQHFASALASARLALPATAHEDANSINSEPLALPAATAAEFIEKAKLALPPSEDDDGAGEEGASLSKLNSFIKAQKPCEPIIEEPRSPEPAVANVTDIEDMEDYETFVGVSSQPDGSEKGSSSEAEINLPPAEVTIHDTSSKAMVLLPPGLASIPVPKLKNVGRLRTVHYVYELPDNHPLVQEMDPREADDPCVYLLAIWSPGESPQAPPVLDDPQTDGTCDGFNNSEEESVKGTLLVPCRTAMRGIFPLNGTYFQVNEVFADHASSILPIEVPRTLLWNLRRRFVYFGTSVTTIFKGLSTEEIQACFWRGYVCVRGFDNVSRCPRPLAARLHFPASKMIKKQKGEKNSDSNTWTED